MSKNTREPQVRQFKLSSGEEIVCEVVDWTGEEEESKVIASGSIFSHIDNTPLMLRSAQDRGINDRSSE